MLIYAYGVSQPNGKTQGTQYLKEALQNIWEGKVGPQFLISDVELGFSQPLSPEADIPLPQLLCETLQGTWGFQLVT